MRAALLLAVAVLLPGSCLCGLGLGGLAPAPATTAVAAANIAVPTDLCDSEFCLAAAPAACGGNCILTPLGNSTEFCGTACIAVWNSASVQGCLLGAATGVYIQTQLTAIATRCNAGALAAARKAAALAKYKKLFPCTATVNSTILLNLDTCLIGTNATATNCPAACSNALLAIPSACVDTFPKLDPDWNATLSSCIEPAAAPGASPVATSTVGAGSGSAAAFGPSASDTPTAAPSSATRAGASAVLAALLAGVIAVVVMLA